MEKNDGNPNGENIHASNRPLTLEARIIIALVKRLGTNQIEISAEELASAVGVAMYTNEDASKVIIQTV